MIKELIGHWILDPEDDVSINIYGHILLKFSANGILTYTVLGKDKDHISIMTYEIEGSSIITSQPSHPKKEETKFSTYNGNLNLELNGVSSRFLRLQEKTT